MRYLLFVCTFFIYNVTSAQVDFSSIPFAEALQKAQSEGKLIFLQFEAANCNECNDAANKSFENKEVADDVNRIFFSLKIDAKHPDRQQIAQAYNMDAAKGFGSLFLDYSGNIIHKFSKTTSRWQEYSKQVDIALLKAGESLKINDLEQEYKKGNRSHDFIKILLQQRRTVNLPTDALLDEYVDSLPPDSLKSIHTLGFIAEMAPLIGSKADKVLRNDRMLFDKMWYGMSSPKRSAINNIIINKSLRKAIKEKSETYAVRTASFAQATNGGNYAAGAKAYDMNILRYYDETGDTAKYFRKAIAYFDKYYMPVSADSIKRTDSLNMRRILANANIKSDTVKVGDTTRIMKRITYQPLVQNYGVALNNAAYKFYLKTNNSYLISIATEWAEKALQFYKSPAVLDTYAKLLYKQNQTTKAIEVMSEAIALQRKKGYPTKEYDTVLEKMKNKSPLQD